MSSMDMKDLELCSSATKGNESQVDLDMAVALKLSCNIISAGKELEGDMQSIQMADGANEEPKKEKKEDRDKLLGLEQSRANTQAQCRSNQIDDVKTDEKQDDNEAEMDNASAIAIVEAVGGIGNEPKMNKKDNAHQDDNAVPDADADADAHNIDNKCAIADNIYAAVNALERAAEVACSDVEQLLAEVAAQLDYLQSLESAEPYNMDSD